MYILRSTFHLHTIAKYYYLFIDILIFLLTCIIFYQKMFYLYLSNSRKQNFTDIFIHWSVFVN